MAVFCSTLFRKKTNEFEEISRQLVCHTIFFCILLVDLKKNESLHWAPLMNINFLRQKLNNDQKRVGNYVNNATSGEIGGRFTRLYSTKNDELYFTRPFRWILQTFALFYWYGFSFNMNNKKTQYSPFVIMNKKTRKMV